MAFLRRVDMMLREWEHIVPQIAAREWLVYTPDGVQLPTRLLQRAPSDSQSPKIPPFLITHGLGPRNPAQKDASNDEWVEFLSLSAFQHSSVEYLASFTARGHGYSTGWEDSAEENQQQFTWRNLADDMNVVVESNEWSNVILGGSSMGSATALYTAIAHPEKVHGLILVRPPTAWGERKARRRQLLSSAKKRQKQALSSSNEQERSSQHHWVLRGTAYSDLPSLDDTDLYARVTCPVLILTIAGDASHPVTTATALRDVLPNARLHIASDEKSARADWPVVVGSFLEDLKMV